MCPFYFYRIGAHVQEQEQEQGRQATHDAAEGVLQFHTAWTGAEAKIKTELEALINSFLMTQDSATATFTVWWMDRDPDPNDPLEQLYKATPSVYFKRVNLHALAAGTCLEGKPEYLDVAITDNWARKGTMGPKEKSDMTRILILYNFGGVWVDTGKCYYCARCTVPCTLIPTCVQLAGSTRLGACTHHMTCTDKCAVCLLSTPCTPRTCRYRASPGFPAAGRVCRGVCNQDHAEPHVQQQRAFGAPPQRRGPQTRGVCVPDTILQRHDGPVQSCRPVSHQLQRRFTLSKWCQKSRFEMCFASCHPQCWVQNTL